MIFYTLLRSVTIIPKSRLLEPRALMWYVITGSVSTLSHLLYLGCDSWPVSNWLKSLAQRRRGMDILGTQMCNVQQSCSWKSSRLKIKLNLQIILNFCRASDSLLLSVYHIGLCQRCFYANVILHMKTVTAVGRCLPRNIFARIPLLLIVPVKSIRCHYERHQHNVIETYSMCVKHIKCFLVIMSVCYDNGFFSRSRELKLQLFFCYIRVGKASDCLSVLLYYADQKQSLGTWGVSPYRRFLNYYIISQ